MSLSHRKLYLLITLIIIILGGLTIYEIIRTSEISTTKSKIPLVSAETYAVPLSGNEPTLGNPGAQNMIILFADLGSPESKKVFGTLKDFVQKHPEQFKLVWKDALDPTFFSKNSIRAHVGAYCAGRQNKFWPFAEEVFSSKKNLEDQNLATIAQNLSLNIPSWSTCFTATSTKQIIEAGVEEYRAAGIITTPVLFINGKKIHLVKEIKLEDILDQLVSS